ncbi:MAG: glycosyltransferase [Acholeplasmatales bacterium]|nr:glycosyltransferase [Acholeplasmatales bacterium]
MQYFLDIIVPQFKEDESYLKNLLNSLEKQDVDFNDFRVLIIGDIDGYKLSKSFLNGYRKINVEYIIPEIHNTQGMAEQYGIDISQSKYVTFLDADDEFIENRLKYVIDALKKHDFDMLLSHFIEEVLIDNKYMYTEHKNDLYIFMHGLFLKREYLINNNIRFNERLRYCEDSYFTKILFMTSSNHPILNVPIYLWKYNKNSTMRSNDLINKLYDDNFKCINDAYEYIIKKNNNIENKYYLLSGFFELFIKLESQYFDKNKKNDKEKELYNMYLKYKDIFIELSDKLDEIYESQLELTKTAFNDIKVELNYKDFIGRDING